MMMALVILVLMFWIICIPHFQNRNLQSLPERDSCPKTVKVSLVMAARDEAEAIEKSIEGLLAQNWPDLELIVVDDRSSDGTSAILDGLCQKFPQLQVIHNQTLPKGWLGKCWALHCGAQKAQGTWLIFCDGDVFMKPHMITSAVSACENNAYDHLCVAPRMISKGFLQDSVVAALFFLFCLFQNPRTIFDPHKPYAYMGNGAFNMVRRELYQSFGGHEVLKLEVVDDIFLGKLMKEHGGRSAFFLGQHLVEIHWYASLWQYTQGLEKNTFAGLRFSWLLLLFVVLVHVFIFFLPIFAIFLANFWIKLISFVAILVSHSLFLQSCIQQQVHWTRAFFLIPAIFIQIIVAIRSAVVLTRQRGVVWRGNYYSLDELKEAQKNVRGPLLPRKNAGKK